MQWHISGSRGQQILAFRPDHGHAAEWNVEPSIFIKYLRHIFLKTCAIMYHFVTKQAFRICGYNLCGVLHTQFTVLDFQGLPIGIWNCSHYWIKSHYFIYYIIWNCVLALTLFTLYDCRMGGVMLDLSSILLKLFWMQLPWFRSLFLTVNMSSQLYALCHRASSSAMIYSSPSFGDISF